jgi:hypothetical protein
MQQRTDRHETDIRDPRFGRLGAEAEAEARLNDACLAALFAVCGARWLAEPVIPRGSAYDRGVDGGLPVSDGLQDGASLSTGEVAMALRFIGITRTRAAGTARRCACTRNSRRSSSGVEGGRRDRGAVRRGQSASGPAGAAAGRVERVRARPCGFGQPNSTHLPGWEVYEDDPKTDGGATRHRAGLRHRRGPAAAPKASGQRA